MTSSVIIGSGITASRQYTAHANDIIITSMASSVSCFVTVGTNGLLVATSSGGGSTFSGTTDVFTKFTSATTIGDTSYNIHEDPTAGTLLLGPSTDNDALTYGQIAHAKGNIANKADAQTNQIILKNVVNVGNGVLYSNPSSSSGQIEVPLGGMLALEMQIAILESTTNNATYLQLFGAAINPSGTAAIVGGVTKIVVAESASGIHDVNVSVSGSYLVVEAINAGNDKANFVCYVRYTQTLF
jgi:hypothetical protein